MFEDRSGHFLQIPGTQSGAGAHHAGDLAAVIDHRSQFGRLGLSVIDGCSGCSARATRHHLSVLGHWRLGSAIVNTLSPGDRMLMVRPATSPRGAMAQRHGIDVEFLPGTWRRGIDARSRSAARRQARARR